MKFTLLAVGTRMPGWVEEGVNEYTRRLPAEFALPVQEIPLARRGKNSAPAQAMAKEAEAILTRTPAAVYVVVLDVLGRQLATADFATRLESLRHAGRDVVIVAGGPDGLDQRVLRRADERWSLSALTLPHPLVRIVLAEQFYRAWSLLNGHPYHRE